MSQPTPRFPVDPAQREGLKAALLARHAKLYAEQQAGQRPQRAHPWLPRLAMAGALAALLLVSFAAPAERELEVGRRITLVLAGEDAPPPDPKLLVPLLEQLGKTRQIQVQLKKLPAGLTLQVELWGAQLAPDAAERLRAAIPELRGAAITDEPLRGRARTRLGLIWGRRLLGLTEDPAQIAAARAWVEADLAARGEHGKVDIQVERGADGRRKVRATVESHKTEVREVPEPPAQR